MALIPKFVIKIHLIINKLYYISLMDSNDWRYYYQLIKFMVDFLIANESCNSGAVACLPGEKVQKLLNSKRYRDGGAFFLSQKRKKCLRRALKVWGGKLKKFKFRDWTRFTFY